MNDVYQCWIYLTLCLNLPTSTSILHRILTILALFLFLSSSDSPDSLTSTSSPSLRASANLSSTTEFSAEFTSLQYQRWQTSRKLLLLLDSFNKGKDDLMARHGASLNVSRQLRSSEHDLCQPVHRDPHQQEEATNKFRSSSS